MHNQPNTEEEEMQSDWPAESQLFNFLEEGEQSMESCLWVSNTQWQEYREAYKRKSETHKM